MSKDRLRIESRAVHGRLIASGKTGPVVQPIFQSATFRASDFEEQVRLREGNSFYTRYGNPTHAVVESAMADLEGADAALVFSSGMAAITTALLAVLGSGDHIVAQRELYGGTFDFLTNWAPRFGIEVTFVDAESTAEFSSAIQLNTKIIFVETPTNPTLKLVDLESIGALGKRREVLTFIDNTFATPINQRPIELGIDVVLHSATKYLGGHSDIVCGAVAGAKEFIIKLREARITFGGTMDPHASWLLLRGLKTLAIRVERQNENALRVAEFLEKHRLVKRVHYPFLNSHPNFTLARKQMSGGGGLLSFEIHGGAEDARHFVESLNLFSLAGSFGGVESLATIPALTSHAMLSQEDKLRTGVTNQLIRLAVGVEHADDLISDLKHAFEFLATEDHEPAAARV
jgi:cystathionine beta-lyase/cystathionine gamma-synthase